TNCITCPTAPCSSATAKPWSTLWSRNSNSSNGLKRRINRPPLHPPLRGSLSLATMPTPGLRPGQRSNAASRLSDILVHTQLFARGTLMSHTYSRLLVHVVFSTKHRQPLIHADIRDRLYEYMAG